MLGITNCKQSWLSFTTFCHFLSVSHFYDIMSFLSNLITFSAKKVNRYICFYEIDFSCYIIFDALGPTKI